MDEVCHKLCICNAVRDALEGEVLSVRFQQLLLKPNKRMVDFILEVCTYKKKTTTKLQDMQSTRLICNGHIFLVQVCTLSLEKDRQFEMSRKNMATFMK